MKLRFLFILATIFLAQFNFAQSYVEIGSGTTSTSYPVYDVWAYGWYSAIYPQTEIGEAKDITKIAFDCTNGPKNKVGQKIYMKHATSVTFPDASYENPESNGYVLVYDGDIVYDGWTEIELATAFNYNGTDNIIVHYENHSGSYTYANFNSSPSAINNNKGAGSDNYFPAESGYLNPYPSSLPNIRFYYSSSGPTTPANPVPSGNEQYVDAETQLSFDVDETVASYDVYFSSDMSLVTSHDASALIADDIMVTGAGTYSANPTNGADLLESKTMYYWQVVVSDGSSTSNSPIWAFETQKIIGSYPYNQDFEGGDDLVFHPYGSDYSDWDWYDEGVGSWNDRYENAQNGDSCAYISASFLDQGFEYYLMTPRFNLPESAQISFWWYNGAPYDDAKTSVADSTVFQASADGGLTWETLAVLSPEEAQTDYVQEILGLGEFAGDNTYFRWVYKIIDENYYPQNVYLDNIEIQITSGSPQIAFSSDNLVFPELCPGGRTRIQLAVTNENVTQDLVVTGVSGTNSFSCDFSGTISGGETVNVDVYFHPATNGTISESITFEIQGAFTGNNVVQVSGESTPIISEIYEYFDDTPEGQMPAHWNKIDNPDNPNHFVQVESGISGDYHTAPNLLRLFNIDDYSSPLMAIMPGVDGFGTNELKFWAVKSAYEPVTLIIGVTDDPYHEEGIDVVASIDLETSLVEYTVPFDAGNTKPYIVFKHQVDDEIMSSIRIDDVEWYNPGSNETPNPANVALPLDNANSVDIMNGIMFKWTNGGGAPSGYRLSIGTNQEANNIVDDVDMAEETQYYLNENLEYSNTYYWKVIPYNANGDAEGVVVWQFNTMTDPVITTLPWSEDFNNYVTHVHQQYNFYYPLGWSLENNNSTAYCWDKLANNANYPENAHSDSIAMHLIGFSYSESLDDWLFTPPFELETGKAYEFGFWYKTTHFTGEDNIEKLEVKMGTGNNSESMMEDPIFYDDQIEVEEWTQFTTTITVGENGQYYFGFHGFSDPMQWILHIDDVSLTEIETTNHTVTFNVSDEYGAVENATISINGEELSTNEGGVATTTLINGTYNYTVEAEGYGTINGSVVVDGADESVNIVLTGIDNMSRLEFSVYPNPTNGEFTFDVDGQYNVTITNSLGKCIYNQTINRATTIDLSDQPKGVYFVHISGQNAGNTLQLILK